MNFFLPTQEKKKLRNFDIIYFIEIKISQGPAILRIWSNVYTRS